MTIRAIIVGGGLLVMVGAAAVVALIYFYGGGTDRDRAGLEVVRTAGTIVVVTGGAIALLLTALRQRATELTLEHQRKVAAATERDAAEQRITELYTHAVDQLGNEKAPVRLGGLHALERLAQNNPGQRQTIVDVICAYLRMPYTPPDDKSPAEDAPAEAHTRYEQRRQELQVRMTAQRILAAHLSPMAEDDFWVNIDLDLSEAHLYKLDLTSCNVRNVQFSGAQFARDARFGGAQFDGTAQFDGARFGGEVVFLGAQFSRRARFGGVQFSGLAQFDRVQFGENVVFREARFGGPARFDGAKFIGIARFDEAQFGGVTVFGWARFSGSAAFDGAQFCGVTVFREAEFSGDARCDGARARPTKGPGPPHILGQQCGIPAKRPSVMKKAGYIWCTSRAQLRVVASVQVARSGSTHSPLQ